MQVFETIGDRLRGAGGELHSLRGAIQVEIDQLAETFVRLAEETDVIAQLAGAVVGCAEDPQLQASLRLAQELGEKAEQFVASRLKATCGILAVADSEIELLQRLSSLTLGQKKIAKESDVLSLLTNIEVARLGEEGAGFHYLARELGEFSRFVISDMQKMGRQVGARRTGLAEAKDRLASALPRTQREYARIEDALQAALQSVDESLAQLAEVPVQFRACVEEIAQLVAGVVAAVQAQDITHQQLEHVQQGMDWIERAADEETSGCAEMCARLTVQAYQLRSTRVTLGNWVRQIERCMSAILDVSSSSLLEIAPLVLRQERELTAQLGLIEGLERQCQDCSRDVRVATEGLTHMTELVRDHLRESTNVRDRLQLLTFNSIIESSRLGGKADAILSISHSIKSISTDWEELTRRSETVMQEMCALTERTSGQLAMFSNCADAGLQEAQDQARVGLRNLRAVISGAGAQIDRLQIATEVLHEQITKVQQRGPLFAGCFKGLDRVLADIEGLKREREGVCPGWREMIDTARMERECGASYTTEMEREVLRAALRGAEVPVWEQATEGNSVELF